MASTFANVKNELMDAEGGLSTDRDDYGGTTKYGISKLSYPHVDIPSLTFPQACAILERDFWNYYRLSQIDTQAIANKIFLALINGSPKNIISAIQRALRFSDAILEIDGVFGSKTIAAINSAPQEWLLDWLRVELCVFYVSQVDKYPIKIKYLKGWIRRALK